MGNWIREVPLKRAGSLFVLVSRDNNWPRDLTPDCTFVVLERFLSPIENWNSRYREEKTNAPYFPVESGIWARLFSVSSNFPRDLFHKASSERILFRCCWNRILDEKRGKWQNKLRNNYSGRKFTTLLESERTHVSLNEQRLGKMSRLITVSDTKGERCWGALSEEKLWKYRGMGGGGRGGGRGDRFIDFTL